VIRVLLDENLPRRLKWSVQADVATVPACACRGVKNRELLELAASEFDILLTMDREMEYQQNLGGVDLCLVLISAASNYIDDLLPLVPAINEAIGKAVSGGLIRVGL